MHGWPFVLLRCVHAQAHGICGMLPADPSQPGLSRPWLRFVTVAGALAAGQSTPAHQQPTSSAWPAGEANPPMYGDYEAQRHWMEVTTHLPLHHWCGLFSGNPPQYSV